MQPHKLPREENVTIIHADEFQIGIVNITDENKDYLLEMVLSAYLGESCKYCGRIYETLDDLKETVWAGPHERGRLACKACWQTNNG